MRQICVIYLIEKEWLLVISSTSEVPSNPSTLERVRDPLPSWNNRG